MSFGIIIILAKTKEKLEILFWIMIEKNNYGKIIES